MALQEAELTIVKCLWQNRVTFPWSWVLKHEDACAASMLPWFLAESGGTAAAVGRPAQGLGGDPWRLGAGGTFFL